MKAFTRGDLVILCGALVLVLGLYVLLWHPEGHGADAMVLVDGKNWARLNLFHDQDLHVPGLLGDSHIQVRDGRVRFVDSPCTTKQCVHQGWMKQGGEVAVCLPNRVTVQIAASDPRFDSINF